MKRFDNQFKTQLNNSVSDIENNSVAEIVVIVKARSSNYQEYALWFGFIFMVVVYSFFMFSPFDFDVFFIYFFTITLFLLASGLSSAFPFLMQWLITKKARLKNTEIYARAIFQKGGIMNTKQRIGVLFFVSLFEKQVFILPDKGAMIAIPDTEWQEMHKSFMTIFSESDVAGSLITQLDKIKPLFSKYLPSVENDINELPDDLSVEL